jgi:hypothetical protein
VLPGPSAASPPTEHKSTAIWRKITAIQIFQKFRYFSAIFGFSYRLTLKTNAQFSLKFKSFGMFFSQNSFKIKFRYFPLLLVKIYSVTAIKMSPLLGFIFR